jgi:hypothetical protein
MTMNYAFLSPLSCQRMRLNFRLSPYWLALMLITWGAARSASGQGQPQPAADRGVLSEPTFEATSIQRQPVNRATILISFNARTVTSQLDIKVAGSSSTLHRSEMKPDELATTLSGLRPGQKPQQLSATVTSASGYSGALAISGTVLDEGFRSTDLAASLPYDNKNGQVKVGTAKGTESGPVTVSGKPVGQTKVDGYVVTGKVRVNLKGVSKVQSTDQQISVTAEGISLLNNAPALTSTDTQVLRSVTFAAAVGDRGRIITEVTWKDKSGRAYVTRSYLDVMADANSLYTSTSGFVDLEIQQLNANHVAHRATDEEYASSLNRILSGETEAKVK